MKPFVGLTSDSFATYSPEKWSSNVHNLARMRVKEAMAGLGEQLQQKLTTELAGLERGASDEIPSITNQKKVDAQWIFWFRDAAARAALAGFLEKLKLDQTALLNIASQDKHAAIAVVLRQAGLWVGLRVAPGASVDRRNLIAKLGKSWERERMLELLRGLPDGATVGVGAQDQKVEVATLASLDAEATSLAETTTPEWHAGHVIAAEQAVASGTDLIAEVGRWVAAVAPLYRFVAWTRDNDHIEASKQLQEEKAQKRRQSTNFNAGDRVRIVSGFLSGKIGVVQEMDTKARVKVRVGKMSVVVAGTDLAPAS